MKPQTVPSPGKMLMAQDGSFIRRLVSRSAVHTREACRGVGGQSLVSNTTPASEPELGHDLRTHALGGHSNYAGVVVMKINTLAARCVTPRPKERRLRDIKEPGQQVAAVLY